MNLTLFKLGYSPWSERALWALDHHGLARREREYTPIFGEPGMRLKARRFKGRVTVPLLVSDDGVYQPDAPDEILICCSVPKTALVLDI